MEKKLYLLYIEDYFEYEMLDRKVTLIEGEEEAKKAFNKAVREAKKMLQETDNDDWETNEGTTSLFFEAYPDGSWGTSHYFINLKEIEVGKGTHLLC